ncbi:MAG: C39 family peptidase [Candidatus Methanoperedens sp.]|nr:C39 family peptidase [Candidatus Methanoperedens sp.]
MKNEKSIKVLLISIILILIIFSLVSSASPDAYMIKDVPMHKQLNGLSCGPAALETMFDYNGVDIDQKSIADVARTSSDGTWTWDMVRTGHFSHLSAAQGSFFPHSAPLAGFAERSLGYSTFSYSNDTFWWTDLKELIAADIPVVLLMRYAPEDDGGHYRVIVGYNEIKNETYFIDPWGRDQKRLTNPDGTVTWTMDDFQKGWNYSEYGTSHPHWGAIMMPWSIDLQTTERTTEGSMMVKATITYPCMGPFNCSDYPASNTTAKIDLPSGIHLDDPSASVVLGDLPAGENVFVSWNVSVDPESNNHDITVSARGRVSGSVPRVFWRGNKVSYPPYSYTDEIGGIAIISDV